MVPTIELRLDLTSETTHRLRYIAQQRGVSEAALVEQALTLLFAHEDTMPLNDYMLSVSAMHEDWDTMPEDWIADEVANGVPAR